MKEWLLSNHRLAEVHIGPLLAGLYYGVTNGELRASVSLLDFSLVEDGMITFLHVQFYLISFEFSLTLFEPVYVLADKKI